jgi:uncharacterized protein YhbP (UPF0306 family)
MLKTVKRALSEGPVRRSLFRILEDSPLCSIATVGPGNRPHINTAYFAYTRDLVFCFLSDPDSIHCRNLRANPSIGMTVFRSAQAWGTSNRGVQLFGRAREVRGAAARAAERVYARRFPKFGRWLRSQTAEGRALADQVRSYRFYRFVPSRAKILDEGEFGGAVFLEVDLPRRRRA